MQQKLGLKDNFKLQEKSIEWTFKSNVCWQATDLMSVGKQLEFVPMLLGKKMENENEVFKGLGKLVEMEKEFYEMVLLSKRKDDKRGRRMFHDYDRVHQNTIAEKDVIVREAQRRWQLTRDRVNAIINGSSKL